MPPNASADNGGFAWLLTIRPRGEHFNDDLVQAVSKYVDTLGADWHLIVMEKGNHLHCAVFLHEPQQRSNLITKFINNPLKGFDDDEKKNFRKYDRASKTGAVLNMTTLGMVAEYLSGDFDRKLEDEFEVISEHLPPAEDISELEEYLPAVDGLKRKRQVSVWFAKLAEDYRKDRGDTTMTESEALSYIQYRMFVAKDMDIIADQRILRQKVRSFVPYFNGVVPDHYSDYKHSIFPHRGPYPYMGEDDA